MDLRIHFALLVGLCLGAAQPLEETSNGVEISDLSYICKNRAEDTLVPHPFSCTSYFACGATVPILHYCDAGLIFDELRSLCDIPERSLCTAVTAQANSTSSGPNGYLDTDLDWWENKPRPIFVAVDVKTGLAVNPMEKYDPRHVECRHFGAYFLPHPSNCQSYFICAYGHLHRHQCGAGTLWNYKSSECQLNVNAECYGSSNGKQPMVQPEITPSSTPGQVTVCYIVSTTSSYSSSSSSLSTERETSTSAVTAPSPPRASQSTLVCPSERQSYLPHAGDCSKYYICIAGMPVLTSCPKGLFWDQRSGYCDQAKNVKCFQNE